VPCRAFAATFFFFAGLFATFFGAVRFAVTRSAFFFAARFGRAFFFAGRLPAVFFFVFLVAMRGSLRRVLAVL
jgi:hypothetical protein